MSEGGWDLGKFSDMLDKHSAEREKQRLEWQAKLGEPTLFVPDADGAEGHGVGYFKHPCGVLSVHRFSNGYDPMTQHVYGMDFINMLNEVQGNVTHPGLSASAIIRERRRQVTEEGFDPAFDDEYKDGQLIGAAISYLLAIIAMNFDQLLRFWPFSASWWKPGTADRNLEKAGALILAEMDRRHRILEASPVVSGLDRTTSGAIGQP